MEKITDYLYEKDEKFASNLSLRDRRVLVLHILYTIECHEYDVAIQTIIFQYEKNYGVSIKKDDQIIVIVDGILNKKDEIDNIITRYLRGWRLERLSVIVRLILRYALWELIEIKSDSALVINEAVELAKKFAEQDSYKFINAVLDNWMKEQKVIVKDQSTD